MKQIMKKVLILGAGLVSKPIVNYLMNENVQVTLADCVKEKAETIIENHQNGEAIEFDVNNNERLSALVEKHDLTVSLLPYKFHVKVAENCLKHKKNMVTTSYVKPEMQALDKEAKKNGVIILNECGLDPGIDHMSAMRIIDHVHRKNGKIEEFYSICGALPAPEAVDNPFKYKFSWSPKGVILASRNKAKYLLKGKIKKISRKNLFKDTFTLDFPEVGELEVYPNRDSVQYVDIYNIPETKTMFRGTFRYKGWCETLDLMKRLDLISEEKRNVKGKTYKEFMADMLGAKDASNIKQKTAAFLWIDIDNYALNALEWLGLFSDKPMNRSEDSPFNITSDLMIEKMRPKSKEERDMVVMQHTFLASYPNNEKEVIKSRMLEFGKPATNTSVALTVALPAAVAVKMILEGKIMVKGVFRPVIPQIYNPILDALEELNIKMIEEFGLPESEMIER